METPISTRYRARVWWRAAKTIALILLLGVLSVGPAARARAAEPESEGTTEDSHHVSLFLGGATKPEEDETGFAIGLDYEYRLNELFGIGALLEVATGGLRDVVLLAPLSLHPYRGIRLVAAPGAEISSDETAFAFRLGVSYEFPFDQFSAAPEFNVDLVEGEPTYIFGVSFGVGF